LALEGDYDDIVNRGSLCAKGISMFATHALPNRLTTPRYRAPYREHSEEISWEFCQSEDDHKVAVVAVDAESGLRVDYCEACCGYVKTYEGEGNEPVLLADWTSLHLDIIARDRGLNRSARFAVPTVMPIFKGWTTVGPGL
jgi:hypothetical protein